jgi:hypothetical protein
MEGIELSKVFTAGIHLGTPLNIDLEINNKGQYCKLDTVWGGVLVGRGRVNEGH